MIIFLRMPQAKEPQERRSDNIRSLAQKDRRLLVRSTDVDSCRAEFVVTKNGWNLEPEKSAACERQKLKMSKLGTYARKQLTMHLK